MKAVLSEALRRLLTDPKASVQLREDLSHGGRLQREQSRSGDRPQRPQIIRIEPVQVSRQG